MYRGIVPYPEMVVAIRAVGYTASHLPPRGPPAFHPRRQRSSLGVCVSGCSGDQTRRLRIQRFMKHFDSYDVTVMT